jgi:hypothetical protein
MRLKAMARIGGNPDLVKYQFKQAGEERLDQTFAIKMSRRQKEKAQAIPHFADKFREWLNKLE